MDLGKLTHNFDSKLLEQILQQFDKIKMDSGISESNTMELHDLEETLGMSFDEMEKEMNKVLKQRTIKIKKLSEDAVFPSYAYETDSGFDLHSTQDLEIPPFGRALVPTGLSVSFEEGYEIQVRPKSGLAIKQGLTVLNTPGTVDEGYTGEIQVIVFNTNNYIVTIPKGMKVAQAVLCPVVQGKFVVLEEVQDVEEKDRGNNGFGSTGI